MNRNQSTKRSREHDENELKMVSRRSGGSNVRRSKNQNDDEDENQGRKQSHSNGRRHSSSESGNDNERFSRSSRHEGNDEENNRRSSRSSNGSSERSESGRFVSDGEHDKRLSHQSYFIKYEPDASNSELSKSHINQLLLLQFQLMHMFRTYWSNIMRSPSSI